MMIAAPFAALNIIPLAVCVLAVIVIVATGKAGFLKKQGVAWSVTILMIAAAMGIGNAKARTAAPTPEPPPSSAPTVPPAASAAEDSYVVDEAGVLSSSTVRKLDQRNQKLLEDMNTAIAAVTCNYGRDDLYDYALERAEEMDLGQYDFIVVLDISGENYWLVQGSGLYNEGWFSDEDCADYARKYMEKDFAKGDYDGAVLSLTEALEEWYYDNY